MKHTLIWRDKCERIRLALACLNRKCIVHCVQVILRTAYKVNAHAMRENGKRNKKKTHRMGV